MATSSNRLDVLHAAARNREVHPILSGFARIALSAETPLERKEIDAVPLWVKREDLTNPRYGGNKVRKLQYTLGHALEQRRRVVLTMGARGSHHVLATTLHGESLGLRVHAVVTPQPETEHVRAIESAMRAAGARLHRASPAQVPWVLARAWVGLRLETRAPGPYFLGLGGSSPRGCLGYVEAGLELSAQLARSGAKDTDIVVPLGSGGTVAGLALGVALAGLDARVIGARVTPAAMVPTLRVHLLVNRTAALLEAGGGPRSPRSSPLARAAIARIEVDDGYLGSGYGHATPRGDHATLRAREVGLTLDPTYTAKAFAAALDRAHAGRTVVYVHTLGHTAPPASR